MEESANVSYYKPEVPPDQWNSIEGGDLLEEFGGLISSAASPSMLDAFHSIRTCHINFVFVTLSSYYA